jgi:hypothetical protein
MALKDFLLKHSTIDPQFLDEFLEFYDEKTLSTDIVIDFDAVCKWLDVKKESLMRTLSTYKKDIDYTKKRVFYDTSEQVGRGGLRYEDIVKITPNCFEKICMRTKSKNGENVQNYFIAIRNLVIKYHHYIEKALMNKLGIETKNKEFTNTKGGLLYILRVVDEDNISDNLYKIGKTFDLKSRMATYNTGKLNQVEILYIYETDNIDRAENCVKAVLEEHQYKNNKEIYQTHLEAIKIIMESCCNFNTVLAISDKIIQKGGSKNVKFSLLALPLK